MLELSIHKYAEPDYFQAHLIQDDVQVMTFFFAEANVTESDDGQHVSFFAHDEDTSACLNLSTVTINAESRQALDVAIELDAQRSIRKQDEAPQVGADSSPHLIPCDSQGSAPSDYGCCNHCGLNVGYCDLNGDGVCYDCQSEATI